MVETTRYSASRLPLISEPWFWRALAPVTWCMKSQTNAEWAASEDSPATPSMADDGGWVVWLDEVRLDDDVPGTWSSAGVHEAAWEPICLSFLRSRSRPRTSPRRRSSWSIFFSLNAVQFCQVAAHMDDRGTVEINYRSVKCMGRTTVESRESDCVSPWASCRQVCNGLWHSRNESRGPACHNGSVKRVRFECSRGESRYHALMLRVQAEARYGWGRRIRVPTFRTRQLSHYEQVSSV